MEAWGNQENVAMATAGYVLKYVCNDDLTKRTPQREANKKPNQFSPPLATALANLGKGPCRSQSLKKQSVYSVSRANCTESVNL